VVDADGVLSSPAVGSGSDDLIRPCGAPAPPRVGPDPPMPGPGIAVALSGGGFRATLAALGVLRFLADAPILGNVRWASSVSGGSVANGLLAVAMPNLRANGFACEALDATVIRPFVDRISSESLTGRLVRRAWKTVGSQTRTDLLADQLDELYFGGTLLREIDPDWRFIFNAANTATGVRFGFERDVVGDYVIGRIPTAETALRLATAVACSAAVPGLLAPTQLHRHRELEGAPDFPCRGDRAVRLVDGGAYDNMGLEPVDSLDEAFLVALNAGGLFVTGRYGAVPVVRDLQLANSLLYRQSTALRRRSMVERFQAYEAGEDPATGEADCVPRWARHGVLFSLGTTMPDDPRTATWRAANPLEPDPDRVARVRTTFHRLDRDLCRDLVYAGWWLTGACISTFHPHLLSDPDQLPRWSAPW
jgi:NTE family protein